VALELAGDRVLAKDIVALRQLPGCDSSAMDGFAARAADLPNTLPVVGQALAGQRPQVFLGGAVMRIMTGAPLPVGADAVVIFEDAHDHGTSATLPAADAGDHIRRAGEDFARGDRAIAAGVRLGWGEIAACAALGYPTVSVARRPVVGIVATGDELVPLGQEPVAYQVIDSTAHALRIQIESAGGVARYLGIARDREEDVRTLIESALTCDVVLTTGGVSAGDRDYVRTALTSLGVSLDFWKVAMKPGKPLAVGTSGSTIIFALPGNPVSSLMSFELFVRPALLAMQGLANPERPRAPVVLAQGYTKSPGRTHYLRASLARSAERLIATPLARQGSHMLSSLIGVDALVEIDAASSGSLPGAMVSALLLRAV
jgi:molybdopterin molybdotransferase